LSAVLVTGGAGYIGSHVVRRLREAGRKVVVIDDLSDGHADSVPAETLVEGDFADPALLERVFGTMGARFVVHLAASCLVGESVANPGAYYRNNVVRSLALADAAVRHGVRGIVFSSSAAVYGEAREVPIPESHACLPTNPYGETKLAFERALAWYARAHGLASISLRYFNAAGAHPAGDIGEDHDPETHLIPLLLRAARDGGPPVPIFGSDYATPDGTCVRDYVHVVDLAEAHVLGLARLERDGTTCASFNLGNGLGFSVQEVIDTVQRVTGRAVPTVRAERRPGDPATLVASSERARSELHWKPQFPDLAGIVATAWSFHEKRPRSVEKGPDRH